MFEDGVPERTAPQETPPRGRLARKLQPGRRAEKKKPATVLRTEGPRGIGVGKAGQQRREGFELRFESLPAQPGCAADQRAAPERLSNPLQLLAAG